MELALSLTNFLTVQTLHPVTKGRFLRGRDIHLGALISASAGLYMISAVGAVSRAESIDDVLTSSGLLIEAGDLPEVADLHSRAYEMARTVAELSDSRLPKRPRSFLDYVLWSAGNVFSDAGLAGQFLPPEQMVNMALSDESAEEALEGVDLLASQEKVRYNSRMVNTLSAIVKAGIAMGYCKEALVMGMASNDLDECLRTYSTWTKRGLEIAKEDPPFTDFGGLRHSISDEFEHYWTGHGRDLQLKVVPPADYESWTRRTLGSAVARLYGILMANRLASAALKSHPAT